MKEKYALMKFINDDDYFVYSEIDLKFYFRILRKFGFLKFLRLILKQKVLNFVENLKKNAKKNENMFE